MYFKLSNTAERETIEKLTKASFKYPYLYKPQSVIHGLEEVTIPIITMEEREILSLAIWGLLPEKYSEDWGVFQNDFNTLNIHEQSLDSELWFAESMKEKRCLVPVTGYFTTQIKDHKTHFHKIALRDDQLFYLAGIYTILEDDFKTCCIFVGRADAFIKQFQNVVDTMPISISEMEKDEWLSYDTTPMRTLQMLKKPSRPDFIATKISAKLYNQYKSQNNVLALFNDDHEA